MVSVPEFALKVRDVDKLISHKYSMSENIDPSF
jgi:hypothetical protein